MPSMIHPEQPVDCIGYVVETAITDSIGRTRYQTSPIYRRRDDADRMAAKSCNLGLPSEDIRRTVIRVRTCFPLADVLSGNATAWPAAEIPLSMACVQSTVGMVLA